MRVDLATLIHHVARVSGIERIRFMTSHPLEFNDSLIEAYANVPKLANMLHLPVQSGSDRILALMKRGYTSLEFKEKIRRPARALRTGHRGGPTDFIVGFPGETDRDFEATLRLAADMQLDQSFCFLYSRRPGHAPPRRCPMMSRLKSSRRGWPQLMETAETARHSRSANRWFGSVQRVPGGASREEGRARAGRTHREQSLGEFLRAPASLIQHFVDVVITEARPHSLRGPGCLLTSRVWRQASMPLARANDDALCARQAG